MAITDRQVIRINNWDKYNSRKDVKVPSWFRIEHSIFEDSDFFDFDHAELNFWLYLLCEASKKSSQEFSLNLKHAERIGRFTLDIIERALRKLEMINCITIVDVTPTSRERNVDVTPTNANVRYTTLHHTTEQILVSTEVENSVEFPTSGASVTDLKEKPLDEGAIEEFSDDTEIKALLKPIKKSTQKRWIKLYSDPQWIRSEFLKAMNWLEDNPQKAPKTKLARFLGGWLSRGWDQHRKSIPSNRLQPAKLKSFQDLEQETIDGQ